MRLRAKRDQVEGQIVAALRQTGWSVLHLSVPNGPDLVCGKAGTTVLLEVKTGNGKLRPGQSEWHREWRGSPVRVVRSVEDVMQLVVT